MAIGRLQLIELEDGTVLADKVQELQSPSIVGRAEMRPEGYLHPFWAKTMSRVVIYVEEPSHVVVFHDPNPFDPLPRDLSGLAYDRLAGRGVQQFLVLDSTTGYTGEWVVVRVFPDDDSPMQTYRMRVMPGRNTWMTKEGSISAERRWVKVDGTGQGLQR